MDTTVKNIVLVDDHIIIRNGLKELIEKLGPYRVSAEFDNGRELVDAFPLQPGPALILMDITMPVMDGDEVVAIMNEKGIDIPVLILTLSQDEQKMIRLFRSGIRGYLHKNCTAAVMKEALESIFKTGYYHNELLVQALHTPDAKPKVPVRMQILEKLTRREKEFMQLVCHEDEYTYDQIAGMMGVVRRTVDSYRESIFDKFDIKSKTGLVLFAIRHRLFDSLLPEAE